MAAMLGRLVGGVLRARSVARDHLPGPLLGKVPLVVFLTGVGQDLPCQLLVIAGLQTYAARAVKRSHFGLLLPLSSSGLELVQKSIVPSGQAWRIHQIA